MTSFLFWGELTLECDLKYSKNSSHMSK